MKPQGTLRRWPNRNFLAKLDSPPEDRYALDDLARHEPRIRHTLRRLRAAARPIEARVRGPAWVDYRDAALSFQLAVFEVAFNLGYENGLIAARADAHGRAGRRDANTIRLRAELRRLLARTSLGTKEILAVLLAHTFALSGAP